MAAWDDDLMYRQGVADFLQNLLESDDEIKVINIDSPWGTGKTFFLENWRQQLEVNRGVVYFNAWKKDYTGDPFVSLVSAINDQLSSQRGLSPELESLEGFVQKASKAIVATAPVFFKFVTKSVVRKVTGIDVEEANEVIQGVTDEVAEAVVQSFIESSAQEQQVVDEFTKSLEKLVSDVAAHKSEDKAAPVYILIDELDRCRPTYAVELLERVKHFFNVPGCKFVIATDTVQLSHSVKAIYGAGFDSKEYLKRFFDLGYGLDYSNVTEWVRGKYKDDRSFYCLDITTRLKANGYYSSHHGAEVVMPDDDTLVGDDINDKQAIIWALSVTFRVSLRGFERSVKHLNASLANIEGRSVHFFFLAYLIFFKNKDQDLYDELLSFTNVPNDFWEKIVSKYPPKKLYFIYQCVDVHAIANDYLRFKSMSKSELRKNQEESFRYIEKIKDDLWHNSRLLEYDEVISLASKIG